MDLAEFDALEESAAHAVLESCAAVPHWAARVAAHRPYAAVEDLLAIAAELAEDWTRNEVDSAVLGDPRPADWAARTDDPEITARLEDGRRLYEKTFERPFVICPVGRDAAGILAELHRRLDNTPAAEWAETHDQLRALAVLRLERVVS